ncbi:MAG: pyridoxamine 5'-phosphate oxidase, partial [Methylovirgula sp.]
MPDELTVNDFTDADEPLALFSEWLAGAEKSEPEDANAMALATTDAGGVP